MKTLADPPADFHAPPTAGVFRIPAGRTTDFVTAASAAGCCVRRIDLRGVRARTDLLARIAATLEFPGWFGHNWDAMSDCLSDLGWLPQCGAYVFLFEGCSGHEEALPVLLEILEQTVSEWLERDIAMWMFIACAEGSAT
jgi:hypothetical protein